MPFLEEVLRHFYVELPQLHANAIARLATFEWALQAEGCEGRADFFAALHFASCQPKLITIEGMKRPLSFGSINFQIQPQYRDAFPANAINGWWYTGWLQQWFYYSVGPASPLRSMNWDIAYVPEPETRITED